MEACIFAGSTAIVPYCGLPMWNAERARNTYNVVEGHAHFRFENHGCSRCASSQSLEYKQ